MKLKSNMSLTDRVVRLAVTAALVTLYVNKLISGFTAIMLLLLGTVFLLSSVASFCPLYKLLGITTRAKANQE